jgi:Uma2 family endonuclease
VRSNASFDTMTALPTHKMTVDEYLAWTQGRAGRFELYAGVVYARTPERVGHAQIKYAVQTALLAAIRQAGVPCHSCPRHDSSNRSRHGA